MNAVKLLVLLATAWLVACSTTRTPRAPNEYLYSTDKAVTQLLGDIRAKLVENKYQIKTFDIETGFLVTEPRRFTVGRSRRAARQTIQLRQEGGSLKLRTFYECEYENDGAKEFEPCIVEDEDASAKIQKIEGLTLKLVKDNLFKHK